MDGLSSRDYMRDYYRTHDISDDAIVAALCMQGYKLGRSDERYYANIEVGDERNSAIPLRPAIHV